MNNADSLAWAGELAAIAQTGLTYTKDPHDIARYQAVRALAARMLAARTSITESEINSALAADIGHATPKIGVRAAVFDATGKILMVRETADAHLWSLPGGWAEPNQTVTESAIREVFEETGYQVQATKLAAIWDRSRHNHPTAPHRIARCFFICMLTGGTPTLSTETSEIAWFAEANIPADLSHARILPHQIYRMFVHHRDPALPTEFD
ncbi:MAG: NUDIX domain-containing protein [Acetobacteraceae bacterium]|nr:NUDIX domain-containing protein [Acetobacteraceae bacterium]